MSQTCGTSLPGGDVLAFLVAGKSNREIAEELDLSISTVKAHLGSLYRKLGVSSRTQAALVGVRNFPMLRVLASYRHGTTTQALG